MASPLEQVRVLDISQVMAGAYCSALLADLGADVIKVERPEGDELRNWGADFPGGQSPAYMAVNRNKRGVAIDLRDERGVEAVLRMAEQVDILVENFRPGTLDRMGLGYDTVSHRNPRLVYCSISGFGQDGPYAGRGGYDLVAQGMSGLMSITGEPDGGLIKVGAPVCDLNAGLLAVQGVLAAYICRLRTGLGQHVDTSLLEAGVALTVWESALYFSTGHVSGPVGSQMRLAAPYEAFRTADGAVTIGTPNQRLWERLVDALELPDLAADPRFTTPGARLANRAALTGHLQAHFVRNTTAYWVDRLTPLGIPAGPVHTVDQVYADPQVRARDMVVEVDHPTAGTVTHIGVPVKFSRTPATIRRPAPLLGQHTREVLAEVGYRRDQIDALLAANVAKETV
nr:CoA transferase [Kibdelosporangium sp. MJ126-NF4]CEL19908.1 CAIB/BAIF family protein [Kibdelosporangium sp. MJ126-NF4]CTQ97132.1 CAIB/BAIF family protein [Kibdelosporangium sp. MJ126-NF4]